MHRPLIVGSFALFSIVLTVTRSPTRAMGRRRPLRNHLARKSAVSCLSLLSLSLSLSLTHTHTHTHTVFSLKGERGENAPFIWNLPPFISATPLPPPFYSDLLAYMLENFLYSILCFWVMKVKLHYGELASISSPLLYSVSSENTAHTHTHTHTHTYEWCRHAQCSL